MYVYIQAFLMKHFIDTHHIMTKVLKLNYHKMNKPVCSKDLWNANNWICINRCKVKFRDQKMVKEFGTNHITRVPGFSSVQFSHSVMSNSLQPHGLQHAMPPCPSPTPRVYPNSCPLSQWCHPTISSSVFPFSSCLQSFPASESFQITW